MLRMAKNADLTRLGIEYPGWYWLLGDEEDEIAIGGIMQIDGAYWATFWMDERARDFPIAMGRAGKEICQKMDALGDVYAYQDTDYVESSRLLEWLGFEYARDLVWLRKRRN